MDMLHEGILHRCIQQLLEKKTTIQDVQDMGEDFECLCKILRTVGRALDHDKARVCYFVSLYYHGYYTAVE
jgi:translation initiation factor 4G